ncbi:MAG TPA: rod shape-determining protein MreC [Pirellulales bacterium]|nr:rod shape-determining protein MreC [Pirellulales bacterium]
MSEQSPRPTWRDWLRRITSPPGLLAISLGTAAMLYFLPARLTEPARNAWAACLQPAQSITAGVVGFSSDKLAWLHTGFEDRIRLATAEQNLAELQERNRRLEAALDAARVLAADSSASAVTGSPTEPLLRSDAIAARVLGHAAQTFLRGSQLLDVGSRVGASPGALVIDGDLAAADARSLIDAGHDLGLESGRMVLAGRRVWGKLATVGAHTSLVRRTTDSGYRDTVQLAHRDGGQLRLGPRGVLVGIGDRLCQIELVAATEPVSMGDEVYTVGDGVLPAPLLYGSVVRVERPAAAAHWQIWMQPAVGADEPREVAVLRMELNPARIANY